MKKLKVRPPLPPETRELLHVENWEKALEALLSYTATENAIQRTQLQLEANAAVARKAVEETCAAAGIPSPYGDERYTGLSWDLKAKTVYRERRP